MILTWRDSRLTYNNLKKNSNLNVLDEEEKFRLWTPDIRLDNTKNKQKIVLGKPYFNEFSLFLTFLTLSSLSETIVHNSINSLE